LKKYSIAILYLVGGGIFLAIGYSSFAQGLLEELTTQMNNPELLVGFGFIFSQSLKANSPVVVVEKVSIEVFGFLSNGPNNTQATTVSWCTSRPAHRSIIASIGESPQKKINNTYDRRFVTKNFCIRTSSTLNGSSILSQPVSYTGYLP
jgi:hypothetical protein